MKNGAGFAPSVQMDENTVWTMGGIPTANVSVIISHDGSGWTNTTGPAIPVTLMGTCAVKLNSTHVFVGSGDNHRSQPLRDAWIYSFADDTWTELPPMQHSRRNGACGLAGRDVVVFGSYYGGFGWNSTEVFNLDTHTWSWGQDFPTGLGHQHTLPYREDTFLAFGVHIVSDVANDTIFQYVPGTKGWVERPERLKYGGVGALPVVVPPEVAPCT